LRYNEPSFLNCIPSAVDVDQPQFLSLPEGRDMICPNCFTLIRFSEAFCSKCGTPVLRSRANAIDFGHMGLRPADSVPVETSQGGIWEPQGTSDEKLINQEFMSRRPPRIPPKRRSDMKGVQFQPFPQVLPVGKDDEDVAARKGGYQGFCPYCDCDQPLIIANQKRYCPGCQRLV
jgi:hypothetical protein